MSTEPTALVPRAGEVVRTEFDATQRSMSGETSSAAVAARETAMVQSRVILAARNPRDVERFRVSLLKECRRPGFAGMVEYHRPVGKQYNEATQEWEEKIAIGPSVHLIRTAIALYQNMLVDSATMYDSAELRLVHAYVLDLENNVSWARTIAISKTVEKRGFLKKGSKTDWEPPKDRVVVSERFNSKDQKVYTVLATEDEVRTKEARLLAIGQRENGRSVLPRDIIDEARTVANETLDSQDKADPDAAMRKLIDAFAELNVNPKDLATYVGHTLDRLGPAELKELRGVFVSVREGESNWDEILATKVASRGGSREGANAAAGERMTQLEKQGQPIPGTQAPPAETQKPDTQKSATPEPEHTKKLRALFEGIGAKAFAQVLGNHGIDFMVENKIEAISVEKAVELIPDLEAQTKLAKETTTTRKQGRLTL